MYTNGYLFREKNTQRKINIEEVQKYNIETCYYQKIKNGSDITLDDGTVVDNKVLTFDSEPERSYAFCSDTVFNTKIVPLIDNVDVLYHESTFLESEAHLAERTMHSTAIQAATSYNFV